MHKPVRSKSPDRRMAELIRLQHEALLRVLQRVWYNDPGGFRTHDLRIKSPVHHSDSLGPTPLHIVAGASPNVRTRPETEALADAFLSVSRHPSDFLYLGRPK